jgi:hypothetical protein
MNKMKVCVAVIFYRCVQSSSGFVLPGISLSRSHSAAAVATLLSRQGLDPLLISRHDHNKSLSIRLPYLKCDDMFESRISVAESATDYFPTGV